MDVNEQFDAVFGSQSAEDMQAEIDAYDEGAAEPEAAEPVEEPSEPESAPEPAPEPAPKAAADTVPLATFLDLKAELRELKRELTTIRNTPPPPVPEEPKGAPEFKPTVSYEDDPAQYLRERVEHQDRVISWQAEKLGETQQHTAEQRQAAEAQRQFQAFAQAVSHAETAFRSEAADYDDAVEYMRNSRFAEAAAVYEANGMERNAQVDEQIRQAITREFASLAANAMQNGRNPANALYKLAKARGYAGKQAPATDKVARIERGVQASKSSQAVGGTAATADAGGGNGGDFFRDLQRSAGYRAR